MITTKIEVPQHLKEYLIGKFCNLQDSPIRFPDKTDIYHFIYDLLERRPANIFKDHGNLTIILPERTTGKDPKTYNYLGIRSQIILIRKIERMLWAEVHDYLDEQKHTYGITYIDGIHNFMTCYGIDSISEDAFKKLTGDNKELLIIPGASHVDLYDNLSVIPFGKMEHFFHEYLK